MRQRVGSKRRPIKGRRGRPGFHKTAAAILAALASGCATLEHENTAAWIERPRARDYTVAGLVCETVVARPIRDWIIGPWLSRPGDRAWNIDANGGVQDSAFFTNRDLRAMTPADAARGPCTGPPPQLPLKVEKARPTGSTPKIIVRDATGRRFFVKLDHPEWPELGSTAEIVTTRILWALGYNVLPSYPIVLEGMSDPSLNGRRAAAVLEADGQVMGHFDLDDFRFRREFRALRVACAWVNEADRVALNTLVVEREGRARYYLIDFNGSLGSWQGLPKEPWRGWRYVLDLEWGPLMFLTLGLVHPGFDPNQPIVSSAVGRFDARLDPKRWRNQMPVTAFDRMTDEDGRWMARRIAEFTEEHLRAIIAEARLSHASDADYLLKSLLERRRRILEAWP